MRILFISPPDVSVIEPFRSSKKKPAALVLGFPIGLGYLAAVARKSGHEVGILDCLKENLGLEDIRRRIIDFKADLLCITVMTVTARTAIEVARISKEINPNVPVVGGGPHASFDYENLIKNHFFDYVVVGEGELTFSELVDKISQGKKEEMGDVLGLAYKKGNEVINNPARPLIADIDELPFPARDLVDFNKYITSSLLPDAVEIMGSRGCSHRCVFCSSSHLFGRWRARSPENITREMKLLIRQYPRIKSFLFYDDNFTVNRKRVIDLCQLMIKEGLDKYSWNCLGRVDQVDSEMLKIMKKAGCQKINYGIESGNETVLKNINKHLDKEKAKKAIRITRQAGIEALIYMMIGNPGETEESIKDSIHFAKELKATSTLWGIATIYPGTELSRLQPIGSFIDYIYTPEINTPYPFTHPLIPVFTSPNLDRERLKIIHRKIFSQFAIRDLLWDPFGRMRKIYHSPKNALMFLKTLFILNSA